ncbi:AmmeMemoRadiSam system protein B [Oxyplasma meridianum]|uniref:AmmeMemoRadiSam system protein B n=1 Tax=Oxyplasma meridianum TaxID=3073602 RepID=A0AAX4NFL7_9ARCH
MRFPTVSGKFYPADPYELRKMLDSLYKRVQEAGVHGEILGIIAPHAGLIYSGYSAMHSFKSLKKSERRKYVIIGTNHSSYKDGTFITSKGDWMTPLGLSGINKDLANKIMYGCDWIIDDEESNDDEYSIEIQLLYLQFLFKNSFSFVPIIMGDQSPVNAGRLARGLSEIDDNFIIVSSSDMTHYENERSVESKDFEIMSRIVDLDTRGFYQSIEKESISICGSGSIATLMEYTKIKKGRFKILHHSTSASVNGDTETVVGYSSMIAYKD